MSVAIIPQQKPQHPSRMAEHAFIDGTAFASADGFALAQRIASALAASELVPEAYRGNIPNCILALDIASRLRTSPFMVMQNLHLIGGRPSWASQFVISAINSSGKFSPLRFVTSEEGAKEYAYEYWSGPKGQRSKATGRITAPAMTCRAWAYDLATGDRLDGPTVSVEMAIAEGWYTKSDSKWKTMPGLMIMYRAAAFFGRLYAPELLAGLPTADEHGSAVSSAPMYRPEERHALPVGDRAQHPMVALPAGDPYATQATHDETLTGGAVPVRTEASGDRSDLPPSPGSDSPDDAPSLGLDVPEAPAKPRRSPQAEGR